MNRAALSAARSGASGERPAAIRSALMKWITHASRARYARAKVVLPAPFGPAITRQRGGRRDLATGVPALDVLDADLVEGLVFRTAEFGDGADGGGEVRQACVDRELLELFKQGDSAGLPALALGLPFQGAKAFADRFHAAPYIE